MSTVSDNQALANISGNLRRLLVARAVSQNGLAREIGESPTRINQYVQGKKMPGAGVLSRIAEFLDVSIDEIVGQKPPRRSGKKSA